MRYTHRLMLGKLDTNSSQDRNLLLLLTALLSLQRHHIRPERCESIPLLQIKMPQECMSNKYSCRPSRTSLTEQFTQFKMKRNPRKLAWTKAFRRAHGKEMTVDSTLAFAQRRNIPVRYNRELVAKTLEAMSRVSEIRARRERQFYKNRMKGNRAQQLEADRKLVEENQHLLPLHYRDQVREVLEETPLDAQIVEDMELEEDELDLEEQEKLTPNKKKLETKRKQRLVRGKGVEEMDVDG